MLQPRCERNMPVLSQHYLTNIGAAHPPLRVVCFCVCFNFLRSFETQQSAASVFLIHQQSARRVHDTVRTCSSPATCGDNLVQVSMLCTPAAVRWKMLSMAWMCRWNGLPPESHTKARGIEMNERSVMFFDGRIYAAIGDRQQFTSGVKIGEPVRDEKSAPQKPTR